MNWVTKHKLLAIEALQYNGQLCIKIDDFWQELHQTFSSKLTSQYEHLR